MNAKEERLGKQLRKQLHLVSQSVKRLGDMMEDNNHDSDIDLTKVLGDMGQKWYPEHEIKDAMVVLSYCASTMHRHGREMDSNYKFGHNFSR